MTPDVLIKDRRQRPFRRRLMAGVVLASSLFAGSVLAQYDLLELNSAQRSISFDLPAMLTVDRTGIAVELDGYDVTSLASIDGTVVTLLLRVPLSPGEHSLSILAFEPNGDIERLMDQRLLVQPSAADARRWQSNLTLASSYRLRQKEDSDYKEVKHWASNGAISVSGLEQSGRLSLKTDVQAMYDSVSENDIDGNEWSLPYFKITTGYESDTLQSALAVGNIYIEQEDLLFSSFQRRGASVSTVALDGGFGLEVFATAAEPTTRYSGDLWIPEDSSNRVSGAKASVAVFDQYLQFSAGYLEGETNLGGGGFISLEDPVIYGGDSWNLAADSRWLENSLWAHVEFAQSNFDSDGIGLGEASETDDAVQAMLQLSSEGSVGAGPFDYWMGSLQYQKVGAEYYSLANLSLPGDLALWRSLFRASKGSVNVDLQWSNEESNVESNPSLPTQSTRRYGINLNYTPMIMNPDAGLWAVVGRPSISANYLYAEQAQLETDFQIVGYELDNSVDEQGVTLMFSHNRWNWSVQYQQYLQDDKTQAVTEGDYLLYQPPSDMENEMTGLQLGWMPSEYFSMNVMVQFNTRTETDFDNEYKNKNYGLDLYYQIIPQTLSLIMNYNQGHDESSLSQLGFIEDDFQSDFVNAQLNWHALEAKGSTPGLDFYLRGSYGKQDNRAFQQLSEQWVGFLGVEFTWASGE